MYDSILISRVLQEVKNHSWTVLAKKSSKYKKIPSFLPNLMYLMLAESGLVFGCFEYHILQPGAPDSYFSGETGAWDFAPNLADLTEFKGFRTLDFQFFFSVGRDATFHLKSSDFLCSNHHFSQEIQWLAPKIKAPEIRGSQVFSYKSCILYPCKSIMVLGTGETLQTWRPSPNMKRIGSSPINSGRAL